MNKILLLIIILFIVLLYTGCSAKNEIALKASMGKMDLLGCDLQNDGPISLEGSLWEFYSGNYMIPREIASDGLRIVVPKFIVPYRNFFKGISTYRYTIITNEPETNHGIFISSIKSAYRIWINGVLISQSGELYNPTSDFIIGKADITEFITSKDGKYDIVVQSYRFNPHRIVFGTKDQILNLKYGQSAINYPVVFIILFMAVYHTTIFLLRRKEKSFLYTGLFCLISAVYSASISPNPMLFYVLPNMTYNAYSTVSFLSSNTMMFFMIFYIKNLYPEVVKNYIMSFARTAAVLFTLLMAYIFLFKHWSIFAFLIQAYNWLLAFIMVYIFITLIKLVKKGKDTYFLLAGYFILFITSVIDIIFVMLGRDTDTMKIGLLLFMFFLAFRLALNFTTSFSKVEQLSERLIDLDRLKDDFLINTAHELKTPMNGIIGLAESIIKNSDGKSSNTADMGLIISSSRRLSELVDNILTFSKMKNRDVILNIRVVNLWQVVNAVFAVLRPLAEEKGIELLNEIPEILPLVDADENKLYQIIYNLAGNAVKFTESGGIRAFVKELGGMIEVSVSDSGIGIPKDKLSSIFLPFEQVGTYENISDTGTGLGLAITKKLVELHGGSIGVESDVGLGSRFFFTLHISKSSRSTGKIKPEIMQDIQKNKIQKNTYENISKGRLRILVVDDEPINIRVISGLLENENYSLVSSKNGVEALEIINKHMKPDLLILDVMMPKMSGYEVCRKVREKYTLHELPILLLTVKNQPSDIQAGFEMGANDYLSKPFNEKELIARIKNLLDMKAAVNNSLAAEINFLQAQIKPHFLYNTLNTIMSLVRSNPEKARELLLELNSYLRESFKFEAFEKSSTLKREIKMLKSYIYIMSSRYPDRINIQYRIDESVDLEIPMLTLQPIVENAIKHGLLTKPEGGTISIIVEDRDTYAYICIEDDGVGISKEIISGLLNTKAKDAGIGVVNVHKRLIKTYGSGIEIESELGKGTRVEIKMQKEGRIF